MKFSLIFMHYFGQIPRNLNRIPNFAVIPSNGDEIKQYQKTLESIFDSLRENDETPCGFALIDHDKPLPEPNVHNLQRNIKYIQLSCHESENLYLADEVLEDMGINWEQAKEKIKERASQFGNKAEALSQADSWDRQNEDIKPLINEIAEIIDPKSLQWTVRLGKVLGGTKPQGQLEVFLGETVVAALWHEE